MFALFGEILFQTIGSPESFESHRSFNYAEHRVIGDRPRLQWLAPDLESIAIVMLFHVSFTDPAAQRDALLAAAEDHQARALVLGNGIFRGLFVIDTVATSDIQLAADGSPVAIRVSAMLREWAPGPDSNPAVPAVPSFTPLGLASVAINYSSPLLSSAGAALTNYIAPAFSQAGVSALVDNPLPGGADGPNLFYADVPAARIVRTRQ
jgi:phage protein U